MHLKLLKELGLIHAPRQRRRPIQAGFPRALSGWQVRWGYGTVPSMTTFPNPYRGFRFPAEVIEHSV